MSKLFEPLTIRSITLKNRIVVSPMCQYSSQDGFSNDWHLVHLGSRAIGGASLIIAEATAVSAEGRITPFDLGIYKDEHIEELKRITDFIHQHNAVAGIQLAHAGRKASTSQPWKGSKQLINEEGAWQTLAPSAIAYKEELATPKELRVEEIKRIINDFKIAAQRALQAGFKVVEIHAAHGYLVHEFLSPLSNERKDEYGGSFENRIRFLLEIVKEVRSVWPEELPLFVRISATEWIENGWNENDSLQLVNQLKNIGVDLIDCSSGGNIHNAKIALQPGYQVLFADKIKKETNILTGAVGLITTAQQAEDIIANNQADVVLLARELLRDPYFPLHAAKQLGVTIDWPVQYERARQ